MKKNVGILFIGGPEHGNRTVIRPESSYNDVRVAHFNNTFDGAMSGNARAYMPEYEAGYSTTVYTRQRVGVGGTHSRRSLDIMVHESISPGNACEVALDILFTEAGGVVR